MRRLNFIVTSQYEGKNLGFIFNNVFHLSGYLIRRNKKIPEAVTVNGNHADINCVVSEGDMVSVLIGDTEVNNTILPCPGHLDIVYEDDDLIVINKKAGQVVHPDHSHQDNTIGNYLMNYFKTKDDIYNFHPVHRLDNGTSGLLVVAKNSYAQSILSGQMHTDKFIRRYLALCSGLIENDDGNIDAPILRQNSRLIKRMVGENGQAAVTEYTVIKRYDCMTLVEVTPRTGRTHQIRVHMSYIGHPLIGDELYGGMCSEKIKRPALHSYEIEFIHPVTKDFISLKAPLPEDILSETDGKTAAVQF